MSAPRWQSSPAWEATKARLLAALKAGGVVRPLDLGDRVHVPGYAMVEGREPRFDAAHLRTIVGEAPAIDRVYEGQDAWALTVRDATACPHPTWTLQREASNMSAYAGARRFTCDACGAWGPRQAQHMKRAQREIVPYAGPRYELDRAWLPRGGRPEPTVNVDPDQPDGARPVFLGSGDGRASLDREVDRLADRPFGPGGRLRGVPS